MPVVSGKLVSPGGVYPADGVITFTLVDLLNRPVIGFEDITESEIISTATVQPSATGSWSVTLTQNSIIETLTGSHSTVYRVAETGTDSSYTYYINVGSSASWVGDLVTVIAA